MPSIFTKIIEGAIPSYKIIENDYAIAFLDIQPLTEGHTLVVPKIEVDYIYDLPITYYQPLMSLARDVAQAIHSSISCIRVGYAVVGLEVAHAHLHLIPIHSQNDMNFERTRLQMTPDQFIAIVERIQRQLTNLKS